ncbi:MAG TPA: hypothetical protein VHJ17_03935 [Thermomonospora sp.]|nr:hypothetical protein [Thermomonospora sp.]
MRRLSSTVIVVVGEGADEVVRGLDTLHNVRAVTRAERTPTEITDYVTRASATYVVHDADPLAEVGEAWSDFFDGAGVTGTLETVIEQALRELRSERLLLPDYYVVLGAEDMPPTRRHWWLGVVAGAAPARVVPARPSVGEVSDVLGRLSAGRWWPADLEGWLRGLPRVVPDRAGLTGADGRLS